mmetsp:Transcript_96593/g.288360  ORF Transcript_96593/g.288360 Transcript_96593/m.288360 type:complete len:236 (+) Transcript_96593:1220-1927(+)
MQRYIDLVRTEDHSQLRASSMIQVASRVKHPLPMAKSGSPLQDWQLRRTAWCMASTRTMIGRAGTAGSTIRPLHQSLVSSILACRSFVLRSTNSTARCLPTQSAKYARVPRAESPAVRRINPERNALSTETETAIHADTSETVSTTTVSWTWGGSGIPPPLHTTEKRWDRLARIHTTIEMMQQKTPSMNGHQVRTNSFSDLSPAMNCPLPAGVLSHSHHAEKRPPAMARKAALLP